MKIKPVVEMVGGLHDGWRMDAPMGISCIVMPNREVKSQWEMNRWKPETGEPVVRYVEDVPGSTETKRKFRFEKVVTHGTSEV